MLVRVGSAVNECLRVRLKFGWFPAYTKVWERGGKRFVGILSFVSFFFSFSFFLKEKGRGGGVDGRESRERWGGGIRGVLGALRKA